MTVDIEFRKAVGRRVRELRIAQGAAQEAIAKQAGITQASLSNYETGKRELPLPTALALSRVYGVSVGYLVGETDEVAA